VPVVLQVLVPCTDDLLGPFPSQTQADQWAEARGLRVTEYVCHDVVGPDGDRAGPLWRRT